MDEDLTVGFKELTTDWDGHDYEVAHRLTAWFNWADDNENEEDRAYLAVTLTNSGSIEVGGKGVFVGITTANTMPFEPAMQEVVISGCTIAVARENTPVGGISFDKNTGILMKRRFQSKHKGPIKNFGFLKNLKDLLVKDSGPENLELCQVVV